MALVLARKAERAIDARPAELTGRGLVAGARWIAWTHLVVAAMVVAFVSAFAIARLDRPLSGIGGPEAVGSQR